MDANKAIATPSFMSTFSSLRADDYPNPTHPSMPSYVFLLLCLLSSFSPRSPLAIL